MCVCVCVYNKKRKKKKKYIYIYIFNSIFRRVNPFDQPGSNVLDPSSENLAFAQNFTVRFLGSMEVQTDRGTKLLLTKLQI